MNRQSTISSNTSNYKNHSTRTFLINQPQVKKFPPNIIKTANYTLYFIILIQL